MASATFGSWSDFKTATPVTLTRYFVPRDSNSLATAMGMTSAGITHIYTVPENEDIQWSGLGMDVWFVGAREVITFNG